MDLPPRSEDDVLAAPVRAGLFEALVELRRPATTQELATRMGRHANTTRVQLERLADAGLIERRQVRQPRGRPFDEWTVTAEARPAGQAPQAHRQLSAWLSAAVARGMSLSDLQAAGRELGQELAPEPAGRSVPDAMHDVLAALGFAPRQEAGPPDRACFTLGNCPYRDAVADNQPVVCSLHRGMTEGLLDRLDPAARLTRFVAKDPYAAGCVIDVALA